MTLKEAGEITVASKARTDLLAPDWYKTLTREQLAAYLRFQFVYLHEREIDWDAPGHSRRRPIWDGGTDSYNVRRTSVWGKMLEVVNSTDAHPGMWVHAHFSPAADIKLVANTSALQDMRPSFLYSAASLGIYMKHCAGLQAQLRLEYNIAGQTLNARMKSTVAYNLEPDNQNFYVLCDESHVSAPPFFRHAFAARCNCDRAIERYLWQAAIDYEAQQPGYDALVSDDTHDVSWWLTDNLFAAVRDIRQHWSNYNA